MNYAISVIFRLIPVIMGLFCYAYGIFILAYDNNPNNLLAGSVIIALGMIGIALYATAATIIRQIIGTFGSVSKYILPTMGYISAIVTLFVGLVFLFISKNDEMFVAGHVICGIGFITGCVATTATASTRFLIISKNSKEKGHDVPNQAFTEIQAKLLISITVIISLIAWIWAITLLTRSVEDDRCFVPGHLMVGLASVCTSLITLVATISRQIRNIFSPLERAVLPKVVLALGAFCSGWGIIMLVGITNEEWASIGYIMIGLGLVCISISSKVILLSRGWKHKFSLSKRIPLIPIFTALTCFILSAFLFEMASTHEYYYVPARVVAALGGICFTLFSIVSVLESGTSADDSETVDNSQPSTTNSDDANS